MARMTPRECVLAALNRELPDRIPFELSFGAFTPALMEVFVAETGSTNPADYWNFPIRSVGHRGEPGYELWQRYGRYFPPELPQGVTISQFGCASIPGSTLHFGRPLHPLRNATTPDEVADYPLPDPTHPARDVHLKGEVEALHADDLAAQGDVYCTLYETAWGIRGFEAFLEDLLLQQEMAEILLDRLLEIRIVQAHQMAEADVDVLRLGDDIGKQKGMIVSPTTWRQWLKPRLKRVIDSAKEVKPDIHIFYHSDGDCQAVIPDLIEIGVTVLNPIQPECMDPVELKTTYGDRLAFWGTIGTQTTMPFGTPQEVKDTIRERIETVGKGGGLLLAPTHILEPEVPWENILAFIEAVNK